MKKRILIILSVVLLFSFLFSFPASALSNDFYYYNFVGSSDAQSDVYFAYTSLPQTYYGRSFYSISAGGNTSNYVNGISFNCSSLKHNVRIHPRAIQFSDNSVYDNGFVRLYDDKTYKIELSFALVFDGSFSSNASFSDFYANIYNDEFLDFNANYSNGFYTLSSIFTTAEFTPFRVVQGDGTLYILDYLNFSFSDCPIGSNCQVIFDHISVSIYDPESVFNITVDNSEIINSDFGYIPPESDTNNILTAMNDIASDANTMLSTVVNFSDDIGINFDKISLELSDFKTNILNPFYDLFPDWLTLLLVFAICMVIIRRAVRR